MIEIKEWDMLGNILFVLALVAVAIVCIALAVRFRRRQGRLLRWGGLAITGSAAAVLIVLTLVMLVGLFKIYTPRRVAAAPLTVAATPDQVARGEHIASFVCAACHSGNGNVPLTGGGDMSKDAGMPLGTLVAPNLTPGGALKDWTDDQIVRAIREGRDPSGRALIMPAFAFRNLSDEDVQALVAYLRSQQAVVNDTPKASPSPLMALMVAGGLFPVDVPAISAPVVAPAKAVTAEYGQYIVSFAGCRDCHGANLSGGTTARAPSLLQAVPYWTSEQFISALRTGVGPSGLPFSDVMPWRQVGRMDDTELQAIHAYLRSLGGVSK